MLPKISVICPTIRPKGLGIVTKALRRQTLEEYEWLICSRESLKDEVAKYTDGLDYKFIGMPPLKEGMVWDLNSSYNALISQAKGELLVSWQDYTFARPDALGRFWGCYYDNPSSIVSGIGNKYKDDTWMVKAWQDPRQRSDQRSFYECYPNDCEWNFCAVPKQALYDIGGFDEGADFLYFGMDGFGVNERIDALGTYKFYLDQTNESFSLEHDRPKDWDKFNGLGERYQKRKAQLITDKTWPKLNFLGGS